MVPCTHSLSTAIPLLPREDSHLTLEAKIASFSQTFGYRLVHSFTRLKDGGSPNELEPRYPPPSPILMAPEVNGWRRIPPPPALQPPFLGLFRSSSIRQSLPTVLYLGFLDFSLFPNLPTACEISCPSSLLRPFPSTSPGEFILPPLCKKMETVF